MSHTADPEELEAIDRAIAGFDGRHVASLESVSSRLQASPAVLRDLVAKCLSGNEAAQVAASWILRRLLERGAVPPPGTLDRLIAGMGRIEGWETRLHLAQSFQWLAPNEAQALTAARVLADWYGSEKSFVRAWACDAIWRLGLRHGGLEAEARRIAALAEADPAASVRARARNLPREL